MSTRARLGRAFMSVAAATAVAALVALPTSAGAQGSQPDACALVPEAELEAAAGYALDPGEAVVGSSKAMGCGYASTEPAAGPDVGILVTTTADGNAKKLFGVKKLHKEFGKSKKVAGLGTRANFSFKKGKAAQAALLVVDANKGVEVVLRGKSTSATALAETQAIATLVLTKLV